MLTTDKSPNHSFKVIFAATYLNIDQVCHDVRDFLSSHSLDLLAFDILLGIREMLINAVRHGAKLDPHEEICLHMEILPARIHITVADHGTGFNWRSATREIPDGPASSGRGLPIVRHYFDTVTYNDIGNEVQLTKEIRHE